MWELAVRKWASLPFNPFGCKHQLTTCLDMINWVPSRLRWMDGGTNNCSVHKSKSKPNSRYGKLLYPVWVTNHQYSQGSDHNIPFRNEFHLRTTKRGEFMASCVIFGLSHFGNAWGIYFQSELVSLTGNYVSCLFTNAFSLTFSHFPGICRAKFNPSLSQADCSLVNTSSTSLKSWERTQSLKDSGCPSQHFLVQTMGR